MSKDVFSIPTRQQIRDGAVADMVNTIDGAVARGPGDDLWDECEALSGALLEAHNSLALAANEAFATSASYASLIKIAAPFIGQPLAATPATMPATITGSAGANWTTSDLLASSDTGAQYAPTGAGSIPAGGSTTIDVVATTGGAATALAQGAALLWVSPPAGLNAAATVAGDASGGTDAETQAAYRQRYLDYRANPPGGGRDSDFELWARGVAGVGFATCLPLRRGLGSVDVAVLDPNGRAVSDAVLTAVQAALDANRPDCLKTCAAVKPTRVAVDLTIRLYLAAGFGFSATPTAAVVGGTSTSIVVASGAWSSGQWVALRDMRQARQIQSVATVGDGVQLNLTQPLYDLTTGLAAGPTAGDRAMPGCPTYDRLASIASQYFLNLTVGGTYYHAALLGRLCQQLEVLNATAVAPAGDATAVVDRQRVEKLVLGDLILEAA